VSATKRPDQERCSQHMRIGRSQSAEIGLQPAGETSVASHRAIPSSNEGHVRAVGSRCAHHADLMKSQRQGADTDKHSFPVRDAHSWPVRRGDRPTAGTAVSKNSDVEDTIDMVLRLAPRQQIGCGQCRRSTARRRGMSEGEIHGMPWTGAR
jgi:hypothetical protein